jgi:hypothetical protein
VCVQHTSVVEVEQLMLAATLHPLDARADQRPQPRRRDTSSKARMQNAGANDDTPLRRFTKRANG